MACYEYDMILYPHHQVCVITENLLILSLEQAIETINRYQHSYKFINTCG